MFLNANKRQFGFALSLLLLAGCASGGGSTSPVIPQGGSAAAPNSAQTQAVSTLIDPSNAATFRGCGVFTSGDAYNRPISGDSLDPVSAQYISGAVNAGNRGGFSASTGYEKPNIATGSTPMLTVEPQVSYHPFPVKYPWLSSFYIERLSDGHAIVVQTSDCHLYESYHTTYSRSDLSAFSGANWDLRKAFAPEPAGSPSAMASGLSLFAGLVRWEDYQSGSINHALDWTAPAGTAAQWKFVRPASATDGLPFRGSSRYPLPYGAHLRLRASFDTAGFGPQAAMVARAMKTYGIYLADTGYSGNLLYFGNDETGRNPWNTTDLRALSRITLADFEVVRLPAVQTVPGH